MPLSAFLPQEERLEAAHAVAHTMRAVPAIDARSAHLTAARGVTDVSQHLYQDADRQRKAAEVKTAAAHLHSHSPLITKMVWRGGLCESVCACVWFICLCVGMHLCLCVDRLYVNWYALCVRVCLCVCVCVRLQAASLVNPVPVTERLYRHAQSQSSRRASLVHSHTHSLPLSHTQSQGHTHTHSSYTLTHTAAHQARVSAELSEAGRGLRDKIRSEMGFKAASVEAQKPHLNAYVHVCLCALIHAWLSRSLHGCGELRRVCMCVCDGGV